MSRKISVYLITGFLGAGKTTLLKNLLEFSQNKKIGIIMNEFGSVGIDGTLVKKEGIDLIEINNGSIFCSCLASTFAEGLIAMASTPIEWLFIESSGFSDPSGMEKILYDIQPKTGDIYDFRGTICIVDATSFIELSQTLEVARKQIEYSHLIVINKADLVDSARLNSVEESIRSLNPVAPIVTTSYGRLDYTWLQQNLEDFPLPPATSNLNCPSNRPKTLLLEADGVFEREKLKGFLQSLSDFAFRIKGFFKLNEGWHYVDGVNTAISITPINIERNISQLVVILKTRQPVMDTIQKSWKRHFSNELHIK
ncbi:GTP-binding protein [Caldicoprobacter algeriensis]|uniref:CobW family GTP-binding protein n=1 Tax=Caldicoprobacter algeriensis TaxID=699281 RepID=UPI00207A3777|nr:GTP-binding protein [Caldicoprobacter algeriensis]MCM8901451.1 GTP-binding protein [Caldicoprobacter algeriensis]